MCEQKKASQRSKQWWEALIHQLASQEVGSRDKPLSLHISTILTPCVALVSHDLCVFETGPASARDALDEHAGLELEHGLHVLRPHAHRCDGSMKPPYPIPEIPIYFTPYFSTTRM